MAKRKIMVSLALALTCISVGSVVAPSVVKAETLQSQGELQKMFNNLGDNPTSEELKATEDYLLSKIELPEEKLQQVKKILDDAERQYKKVRSFAIVVKAIKAVIGLIGGALTTYGLGQYLGYKLRYTYGIKKWEFYTYHGYFKAQFMIAGLGTSFLWDGVDSYYRGLSS